MLPPLPRRGDWRHHFAHPSSRISLPRYGCRVGPRIDLFEACSAFTRVAACTLALPPYVVARLSEGFRHFVTSMPAPVASGWSDCRVGFAPTGKRRLFTAHAISSLSRGSGFVPLTARRREGAPAFGPGKQCVERGTKHPPPFGQPIFDLLPHLLRHHRHGACD